MKLFFYFLKWTQSGFTSKVFLDYRRGTVVQKERREDVRLLQGGPHISKTCKLCGKLVLKNNLRREKKGKKIFDDKICPEKYF